MGPPNVVTKEVPGASAFADEFRDLRNLLDKDRQNLDATRQQFEKAIGERELKLKQDEEKLSSEWAKFRAETTVTVKTMQEGQALDVKDGIIDGKIHGKQIIVEGSGPLVPPPHLMGKRLPPPGMMGKGKGKGMPPGKGMMGKGMPPGKGMMMGKGKGMPPGKGGPPMMGKGKGGPPMGKGGPMGGRGMP